MHELGIAQDLFQVIKTKARESSLKKITKVRIRMGFASGIEEDFLRHSFRDHIFPKTIAQGAEIEVVTDEVTACCRDCGEEIDAQSGFSMECPACGSFAIEISQGRDIYVESIEGE